MGEELVVVMARDGSMRRIVTPREAYSLNFVKQRRRKAAQETREQAVGIGLHRTRITVSMLNGNSLACEATKIPMTSY